VRVRSSKALDRVLRDLCKERIVLADRGVGGRNHAEALLNAEIARTDDEKINLLRSNARVGLYGPAFRDRNPEPRGVAVLAARNSRNRRIRGDCGVQRGS